MEDIRRVEKGQESPENTGQGSIFLIPTTDVPEGLTSGKKYRIIFEGLVNLDDQGATINLDRIYAEELNNRNDLTQDRLETGLTIEINKG